MKRVIIAGASGMVGSIVLRECIASNEIKQILSIIRKPSGINNSKLKEIVLNDFTDYSNIKEQLKDCDAAYFCVGAYTGSVPDQQFKIITVDYATTFADALKEQSPNATLCLLSGAGADLKEKSKVPFARYKGMAENYLINKNFKQLYIFRPAYIYPVVKRKEPNFLYSLFRPLYPFLKLVYPQGVITSEELGKAIFKAGIGGADKQILENRDIKKLV